MGLPKINDYQKFEIVVPSTQQVVHHRPYLVKEEKVLMLAMESKDMKQILSAVVDTIVSCIDEEIDPKGLTPYDVEYLFIKIRSKSVGEVSPVIIKCKKCQERNEVDIDLDLIRVEEPIEKVDNIIDLPNDMKLELEHPSYLTLSHEVDSIETISGAFSALSKCMKYLHTQHNKYVLADEKEEELEELIESLSSAQMDKVKAFNENIPKVKVNVEFFCSKCDEKNDIDVEGMENFF